MKSTTLIIALFFSFVFSFQSCNEEENMQEDVYMWIASERIILEDVHAGVERLFFQYKLNESDDWDSLYPLIAGFDDYEEGYEYLIQVRVDTIENPAQDQYPKTYTLLKIISKTAKAKDDKK